MWTRVFCDFFAPTPNNPNISQHNDGSGRCIELSESLISLSKVNVTVQSRIQLAVLEDATNYFSTKLYKALLNLEFLCHKFFPQQPEHIRFEEAWDVMGCFPLPCQHYSSVALLCLDARCLGFFACGRTMLQIESTSNGLTNIHQHVFFVVSAWEGSAQSFYRTYLPSLQTIWNRHHLHLYPMCFETLSASFPRGHDRETTSKKQCSLTLLLVLQWLNQLSNSIYLLDPSCIHRLLVKHQSKTFKS
jgi:hypothetical protein